MEQNELHIPNHIAIIMDGNGRWAKSRMMPRNYGHAQGSRNVEKICEAAWNMGVKYLTVYAFSTENWKRPRDEVDALMRLLQSYLDTSVRTSSKNNMRVRVLGDVSGLPEKLQKSIAELEDASGGNTGLNFQVAINYGGRDELLRAVRALAKDVKENKTAIDRIDEETFEGYLDTRGIPEPDLLIRTSGEQRISNFLLWQMAYTELYFPEVLWPDFNKKELQKAIEYYSGRTRRYGAV